jgi:hypothetical protein
MLGPIKIAPLGSFFLALLFQALLLPCWSRRSPPRPLHGVFSSVSKSVSVRFIFLIVDRRKAEAAFVGNTIAYGLDTSEWLFAHF